MEKEKDARSVGTSEDAPVGGTMEGRVTSGTGPGGEVRSGKSKWSKKTPDSTPPPEDTLTCGPMHPEPTAPVGHNFIEQGEGKEMRIILCRTCGVVSEYQKVGRFTAFKGKVLTDKDEIARLVGASLLVAVLAFLYVMGLTPLMFSLLPFFPLVSYRDDYPQFLVIQSASVATGNTLETRVDLRDWDMTIAGKIGLELSKIDLVGRYAWVTALTADRRVDVHLATLSYAAVQTLAAERVIYQATYRFEFEAAAGGHGFVFEENGSYYNPALIIPTRSLYMFVDNASGGTIAPALRLHYKRKPMSDDDFAEGLELWDRP